MQFEVRSSQRPQHRRQANHLQEFRPGSATSHFCQSGLRLVKKPAWSIFVRLRCFDLNSFDKVSKQALRSENGLRYAKTLGPRGILGPRGTSLDMVSLLSRKLENDNVPNQITQSQAKYVRNLDVDVFADVFAESLIWDRFVNLSRPRWWRFR